MLASNVTMCTRLKRLAIRTWLHPGCPLETVKFHPIRSKLHKLSMYFNPKQWFRRRQTRIWNSNDGPWSLSSFVGVSSTKATRGTASNTKRRPYRTCRCRNCGQQNASLLSFRGYRKYGQSHGINRRRYPFNFPIHVHFSCTFLIFTHFPPSPENTYQSRNEKGFGCRGRFQNCTPWFSRR